jgi:hypothetical protein
MLLRGRNGAPALDRLLIVSRCGRSSWLHRVVTGKATAAGDRGEEREWTGRAGVGAWTAAGIDLWSSSRAGLAFLLFEEGRRGFSRPKDRPTAEAPTTVAVAQSCGTKMGQSCTW